MFRINIEKLRQKLGFGRGLVSIILSISHKYSEYEKLQKQCRSNSFAR